MADIPYLLYHFCFYHSRFLRPVLLIDLSFPYPCFLVSSLSLCIATPHFLHPSLFLSLPSLHIFTPLFLCFFTPILCTPHFPFFTLILPHLHSSPHLSPLHSPPHLNSLTPTSQAIQSLAWCTWCAHVLRMCLINCQLLAQKRRLLLVLASLFAVFLAHLSS